MQVDARQVQSAVSAVENRSGYDEARIRAFGLPDGRSHASVFVETATVVRSSTSSRRCVVPLARQREAQRIGGERQIPVERCQRQCQTAREFEVRCIVNMSLKRAASHAAASQARAAVSASISIGRLRSEAVSRSRLAVSMRPLLSAMARPFDTSRGHRPGASAPAKQRFAREAIRWRRSARPRSTRTARPNYRAQSSSPTFVHQFLDRDAAERLDY